MHEQREAAPSEGGDRGYKVVYTIVERPNGKKPVWLRIGAAFENRDRSLNVKLDACPTNGTLHIRDYVPDERWPRRGDESPPYRAQNGVG
jgi:hypothetical protein